MSQEIVIERFFETLINGDRVRARAILDEVFDENTPPQTVLTNLMWPSHEMIEKAYRADQLTLLGYHFATRLLRALVDQTAGRLHRRESNGRTVLAFCGPSQSEELGAQIAVDLLESHGFQVRFAGGGVPGDEILNVVNETRPDFLVLFASAASDLPAIRTVINTLREINAATGTKLAVGGGVFNRAEGLAQEIGVEYFATDPLDMVDVLLNNRTTPTQEVAPPKRKAKTKAA
jgi:methanogenic corrinoid protein MtbC1